MNGWAGIGGNVNVYCKMCGEWQGNVSKSRTRKSMVRLCVDCYKKLKLAKEVADGQKIGGLYDSFFGGFK